jgi:hypothetical protein
VPPAPVTISMLDQSMRDRFVYSPEKFHPSRE